jgi:hypothetical protein
MSVASKRLAAAVAAELAGIYKRDKGLNPAAVVAWAERNPDSALHSRFLWDDTAAARAYRLWQAREIITEVEVIYPDGKVRQVYVSPVQARGDTGYATLVEVLNDKDRREMFLAQALAEFERVAAKYADLKELAGIRRAVTAATKKVRAGKRGRRRAA